jgi:hydroxymethylpyrimidine/phosphomethylpyrimidine kinase
MAIILIIAGFDPTGEAGLQADLKTVTILGETGLTIATALTAQNTQGVKKNYNIEKEVIKQQLDTLSSDFSIDAVKIGMLPNAKIANFLAEWFSYFPVPHIVVDPVVEAKNGFVLNEAREVLVKKIFPLAELVTPNLDEIKAILGEKPRNLEEMKDSAKKLKSMGPRAVLVKGGELKLAIDVLYDGKDFYVWEVTKKQLKPVHGTGCILSSAIASFLTKGFCLFEAVQKAKEFITLAIEGTLALGKGSLICNPYAWLEQEVARYEVIEALKKALRLLEKSLYVSQFIPEVRSNLVYALPYARNHSDVAGFAGRLTVIDEQIFAFAPPIFGVSQHIASVVLKVMEFDRRYRSAINIKYRPDFIEKAKKIKYKIKQIRREEEDIETKAIEGMSLSWIVETAIRQFGGIPDMIYDKGDFGKEAMIRVLGRNPKEVVKKVISLAMEVFKYG